MAGRRRRRRVEPIDDWEQLKLLCLWPEQLAYEEIRPLALFGGSVAERAGHTGTPERTLYRRLVRFEAEVAIVLPLPRLFSLDFLGNDGWLKAVNTLENGCGRRCGTGLTQA